MWCVEIGIARKSQLGGNRNYVAIGVYSEHSDNFDFFYHANRKSVSCASIGTQTTTAGAMVTWTTVKNFLRMGANENKMLSRQNRALAERNQLLIREIVRLSRLVEWEREEEDIYTQYG